MGCRSLKVKNKEAVESPGIHARFLNEGATLLLEGYNGRIAVEVNSENERLCSEVFFKINQ